MIFNIGFLVIILGVCGISTYYHNPIILVPVLLLYTVTHIYIIIERMYKLLNKDYYELDSSDNVALLTFLFGIMAEIICVLSILLSTALLFPLFVAIYFAVLIGISYGLTIATIKKKEKNPFDFIEHEDKMKTDKEYRTLYELQQTRNLK